MSGQLVVHVLGPVRSPGVVHLPIGSRVVDAVAAAGGLRKGADIGATNLAALVSDGQRLEVGQAGSGAPPGSPTAAGEVAVDASPSPALVDLNTATAQELDTLPGIGPVTAEKILTWRTANGRFNSIDELSEVPGIGPRKLAELRPRVHV